MKKRNIVFILIAALIGIYLFLLVFPLMLVGPPTALYYIDNDDSISHDVTVEIYDKDNNSIFNKTYLLGSNENVFFKREVQWWFPFPSTFVTWNDGLYTFNFTVDNQYYKGITRDINQYESIQIDVFTMEYPKILIPIRISIVCV
jgi:hypothetical protein